MNSILYKSLTLCLITVGFLFFTSTQTQAQANLGGKFGLGVILGEPTGISLKTWTSNTNAFAAGVAWSFSDRKNNTTMHLHLDYAIHNFNIAAVEEGALGLYYGIGGRVLLRGDDSKFGIRFPLGINYIFQNTPIELFVEIVPIFDIAPDTEFNGNSGLGFRYYF